MTDRAQRELQVEQRLVERATEGLDEAGAEELATAFARDPSLDHDEFDRAAAALALAMLGDDEPMPDALREQLHQQVPPKVEVAAAVAPQPPASRAAWLGWAIAVAAVLVLIVVELRRPPAVVAPARPVIVRTEPAPTPPPTKRAAPSPADARQRLLRRDPEALVVAWADGTTPQISGISGDVVWSNQEQAGFMRLRNLPPNDPRKDVYQLWIFDAERDERFPVDGGVFSIEPGTREAVVPIAARLAVSRATLFAVTVEAPGGVVVSDRSRIAALAKVDG
ncbi:MAG: anti-sigma factor [Deltaproteobacteria bacterium]|nr:anti-sigma factor [Deltaproteobacteria bacterium]